MLADFFNSIGGKRKFVVHVENNGDGAESGPTAETKCDRCPNAERGAHCVSVG